MPLPKELAAWFAVKVGRDILLPNVWPMGYHNSPCVAQVLAWATVLWKEKGEDHLGVSVPEEEMPRFIEIKDAQGNVTGYLFVLLDNLLLIGCDETQFDLWVKRIERNLQSMNIKVKEGTESACRRYRRTQPSDQQPITFAGLEFSPLGWRSSSGDRPLNIEDDLAHVTGTLLWELRVRRIPLFSCPVFYRLLCRTTEEHGDLSEGEWAALRELAIIRSERTWTPLSPVTQTNKRKRLFATDATPRSISWVEYDTAGNVIDIQATLVDEDEVTNNELLAIVKIAQLCKEPTKIILASDSMISCIVIGKQHARSRVLLGYLHQIYLSEAEIEAHWLSTKRNVADTPSRLVIQRMCGRCLGQFDVSQRKHGCKHPQWLEPELHTESTRQAETWKVLKKALGKCK